MSIRKSRILVHWLSRDGVIIQGAMWAEDYPNVEVMARGDTGLKLIQRRFHECVDAMEAEYAEMGRVPKEERVPA